MELKQSKTSTDLCKRRKEEKKKPKQTEKVEQIETKK